MTKLLFIGAIGLFAMACGGTPTPTNNANTTINTNTTSNSANVVSNAPANNANAANTANTTKAANTATNTANANKSTNTTAAKPADTGPKRVTFAAGKSEGTESVSLPAGESKQFVFNAKNGQIFMAESDSKDLEIKLTEGKDAAQKKEPGYYDSTLLGDGDFVFQVTNTSKKEVKSAVKVIVSHTGISKR